MVDKLFGIDRNELSLLILFTCSYGEVMHRDKGFSKINKSIIIGDRSSRRIRHSLLPHRMRRSFCCEWLIFDLWSFIDVDLDHFFTTLILTFDRRCDGFSTSPLVLILAPLLIVKEEGKDRFRPWSLIFDLWSIPVRELRCISCVDGSDSIVAGGIGPLPHEGDRPSRNGQEPSHGVSDIWSLILVELNYRQ